MRRITVILVNYHNTNDTYNCVKSIIANYHDISVIVVNNSPSDTELLSCLSNISNVKLIQSPYNLGFSQGNNLGIQWSLQNSDSNFFFILNNDTIVDNNTIELLEKSLDTHPEAGIAVPRIVFMHDNELLWYGGGEVCWLRGGGMVPGYLGPSTSALAMQPRYVSFASGCAMLVRREVFDTLKGFHPDFFMYEEDLEFSLRTQNMGWKIHYEPLALVKHKVQASSSKDDYFIGMLSPSNTNLSFYTFHLFRNRLINMQIHAKGKRRFLFYLGFSLFNIKTALTYLSHRRWDGLVAMIKAWKAYFDYLNNNRTIS